MGKDIMKKKIEKFIIVVFIAMFVLGVIILNSPSVDEPFKTQTFFVFGTLYVIGFVVFILNHWKDSPDMKSILSLEDPVDPDLLEAAEHLSSQQSLLTLITLLMLYALFIGYGFYLKNHDYLTYASYLYVGLVLIILVRTVSLFLDFRMYHVKTKINITQSSPIPMRNNRIISLIDYALTLSWTAYVVVGIYQGSLTDYEAWSKFLFFKGYLLFLIILLYLTDILLRTSKSVKSDDI